MEDKIVKTVYLNTEEGSKYLKNFRNVEESIQEDVTLKVSKILEDIKKNGDKSLVKYTNLFDSKKVIENNMKVTEEEIKKAYEIVDDEFVDALKIAAENIKFFHEKQKKNSWIITKEDGVVLGQQITALENVGIYVPGGTAAYPSSVLMNAIPAKIAGVDEIIMITPPQRDGKIKDSILVAADMAGVDRIFKVGGAQGIGALAYGTETIPKVYKITGPGNIYVAAAKRRVSGFVGIDMIAGPSEILIIADKTASPGYIAADMISQAEHDEMAACILITNSYSLADKVKKELKEQSRGLERKEIIKKSLKDHGAIIITESMKHCIDLANEIAPEHLELLTTAPFESYRKIKNAGAIFLGENSPEPVGDYFAGPNHTLPTSSTSKFSSGLSVDDFIKKTSLIYYSRQALLENSGHIVRFAENEGLTGHANAIKIRMKRDADND